MASACYSPTRPPPTAARSTPQAAIRVIRETPVSVLVDADGGYGPVAMTLGSGALPAKGSYYRCSLGRSAELQPPLHSGALRPAGSTSRLPGPLYRRRKTDPGADRWSWARAGEQSVGLWHPRRPACPHRAGHCAVRLVRQGQNVRRGRPPAAGRLGARPGRQSHDGGRGGAARFASAPRRAQGLWSGDGLGNPGSGAHRRRVWTGKRRRRASGTFPACVRPWPAHAPNRIHPARGRPYPPHQGHP